MKVKAKKHLGQHFLTDLNIAKKIVQAISQDQTHLLEIGPGMGVLTQFILQEKKNLIVCEIDSESVVYLKKNFPKLENKIIEGDFLNLNLNEILINQTTIIGNFPYNISSQILFKILENRILIPEMIGMFQKEVAQRVVVLHGNKTYGILSVLIQAFYETEYLFTVDENVFNPPPKVKSAVIKLKRIENPKVTNQKLFFNLVKTAFNQRRKTLRNALKSLIIPENLNNNSFLILRPEQLSVNDFIELTKLWEYGKS